MWPQSSSNASSLSGSSEIKLAYHLAGKSSRLRLWRGNEPLTKCFPLQCHSMGVCPLLTPRARITQRTICQVWNVCVPKMQAFKGRCWELIVDKAKRRTTNKTPTKPNHRRNPQQNTWLVPVKLHMMKDRDQRWSFAWNCRAIIIKRSSKGYGIKSWHSPGIK